jgi:hypothetical protein
MHSEVRAYAICINTPGFEEIDKDGWSSAWQHVSSASLMKKMKK